MVLAFLEKKNPTELPGPSAIWGHSGKGPAVNQQEGPHLTVLLPWVWTFLPSELWYIILISCRDKKFKVLQVFFSFHLLNPYQELGSVKLCSAGKSVWIPAASSYPPKKGTIKRMDTVTSDSRADGEVWVNYSLFIFLTCTREERETTEGSWVKSWAFFGEN